MNNYRSSLCNEITMLSLDRIVRLAGWVNKKRDHGKLLFLEIRDHTGIVQCVTQEGDKYFSKLTDIGLESVVSIEGEVVKRSEDNINKNINSGEVELIITAVKEISKAQPLPFPVNHDAHYPQDIRLKYRYLDLRIKANREKIILRSKVISYIRNYMIQKGFLEITTPILTASSPEGARDFLVPSRLNKGKFYALPQAPQQFKQLLMIAGFDKYFQIAPCFRDEDSRADRSPGEFYQLDFEMSFIEQEDVLNLLEILFCELFKKFSNKTVPSTVFPRISYSQAIKDYGTDKPDLRNPLILKDVSSVFEDSNFRIFATLVSKGAKVLAIKVKNISDRPRKFFDLLNKWAIKEGGAGLGYIIFKEDGSFGGPIAKNLNSSRMTKLIEILNVKKTDAVFFICDKPSEVYKFAAIVRDKLAKEIDLIDENIFRFCFIVDFPMYEYDETNHKIDFSHNPFCMPQGGIESLKNKDPLEILAYQYDIVCNGYEITSGAIRNHDIATMYKAFKIAGYSKEFVNQNFSAMINAFKFGAPPHGGAAPGIARILMLLSGSNNIREVIPFPLNQSAQDLMMGAPSCVNQEQLNELGLILKKNKTTI